jgi:hypothetical protein
MLIAKQLALAEDVSVPQLLRPVIEAYLEGQVAADENLKQAVEALLRARSAREPSSPSVTRLKQRSSDTNT